MYWDKKLEKYPRLKKNIKLAHIEPKPKSILLSKFIEIEPSNITVSKYTWGFA